MKAYTDEQVDVLLNGYFRDHPRPRPYPDIAKDMGVDDPDVLYYLLWRVVTGYEGKDPTGPRRVYKPTVLRVNRIGQVWRPREDKAILDALEGAGQLRRPPCNIDYIASVLGRSAREVQDRLTRIMPGRSGTGFVF